MVTNTIDSTYSHVSMFSYKTVTKLSRSGLDCSWKKPGKRHYRFKFISFACGIPCISTFQPGIDAPPTIYFLQKNANQDILVATPVIDKDDRVIDIKSTDKAAESCTNDEIVRERERERERLKCVGNHSITKNKIPMA